jgi:hypothetical protein
MKTDWNVWSPFQSAEVRDICAHLTEDEKSESSRRGGFYGLWVAATLALPLSMALVSKSQGLVLVAVVLVVVHLACIPVWQRMQRRFLCTTAWAREHAITPEQLKRFAFRK